MDNPWPSFYFDKSDTRLLSVTETRWLLECFGESEVRFAPVSDLVLLTLEEALDYPRPSDLRAVIVSDQGRCRLQTVHQLAEADFQRDGECLDVADCNVAFAAFNTTHIRAIQAAGLSQLFLGPATVFA